MVREKLIFKYLGTELDSCPVEALAFISAHQIATGLAMSSIQKLAMCGFVDRLKGNGTVNSSDLWAKITAYSNAAIYPLCPTDDLTANADGYSMELFRASSFGTYNNFVSGDILPTGVTGGATKYFDSGVSPNQFSTNDVSLGFYNRNIPTVRTNNGSATTFNSNRFLFTAREAAFSDLIIAVNTNGSVVGSHSSVGLIQAGRDSSVRNYIDKNGLRVQNSTLSASSRSAYNIYFHAYNIGGSVSSTGGNAELAMYFAGIPTFTANESADFYEAVQWYQTNVITGGRNV